MKKSILFSFVVTVLLILTSCGHVSGPADVAQSIVKAMNGGDFEYVVNHLASSKTAVFTDKQKEEFKALFESEKIAKALQENGKLVSIKTDSEKIAEDGNTATVDLTISYESAGEKSESYKMTKIDNQWYAIMSK